MGGLSDLNGLAPPLEKEGWIRIPPLFFEDGLGEVILN